MGCPFNKHLASMHVQSAMPQPVICPTTTSKKRGTSEKGIFLAIIAKRIRIIENYFSVGL